MRKPFKINSQVDFNRVGNRSGVYPIGSEAFLREFPNSSGAYSTRKLSPKATDVMHVRRSYDNAESNFNANEVKGSGLLDYVVPTDVQALYSNSMYFDGTDYVNFGDILGIASTGFSGSLKAVFQGEQGTLLSKGGQTGGYLLFLDANGTLFLLLKQ